jgi:hypothetical protein
MQPFDMQFHSAMQLRVAFRRRRAFPVSVATPVGVVPRVEDVQSVLEYTTVRLLWATFAPHGSMTATATEHGALNSSLANSTLKQMSFQSK